MVQLNFSQLELFTSIKVNKWPYLGISSPGKELQDIHKELHLIKLKTAQLVEKQAHYQRMTLTYEQLNKQVKAMHRSYLATHKELHRISHTLDHIK